MAELKTKKTKESPVKFVAAVENEEKRKDSQELLKIFSEVTGEKPAMWGTSIIGFGQYHYKSERSSQEGDWPLTGFSPRKQNITVYIMGGFKSCGDLLKKLGKHKISGGSCLYINRLRDIDIPTLKKIIRNGYDEMKKRYNA
ncbi:MAG: DUF1801 domain-containing protein [Candidatus Gracilibacteria bacterium]